MPCQAELVNRDMYYQAKHHLGRMSIIRGGPFRLDFEELIRYNFNRVTSQGSVREYSLAILRVLLRRLPVGNYLTIKTNAYV